MPNKCKENEQQLNTCIPNDTHQLAKEIAHSRRISLKEVYNQAIQIYAQNLEVSTQSSQNTVNAEQGLLSESNRLYNVEKAIIYDQFSDHKNELENLQKAIANIISEEYTDRSFSDLLREEKPAKFMKPIYNKLQKSDQFDIPKLKTIFKIICVHFAEDIDKLIKQKLDTSNEE